MDRERILYGFITQGLSIGNCIRKRPKFPKLRLSSSGRLKGHRVPNRLNPTYSAAEGHGDLAGIAQEKVVSAGPGPLRGRLHHLTRA